MPLPLPTTQQLFPLQDYRIHHEEVCSKLVAIMRERLSANIKQLPALAAAWPAGPQRAEAPPPSGFATTAAKQLQVGGEFGWLLVCLQERQHLGSHTTAFHACSQL